MAKGIDSARMKKVFAERGEYFGLGLAVVLTGLLVYGAVGVPKYLKTPDELKTQLGQANGVFESADSRLNLESEGITTKDSNFLKDIQELLLAPVNPAAFAGMEWNIPLFDTKQRRTEPQYLALTDLRAVFHYGAIDMKVAGGGGGAAGAANVQRRPIGDEWLTVTGLVPFEAQEAEYAEAFRGALDARTNAVPKYTIYQLQRAEVTNMDPAVPVNWEDVPPVDLKVAISDEMNKWTGTGSEYADPLYVSWPPLTQPLPPLTNKDVGDWCLHLPEIPAGSTATRPAAAAPAAAGAALPAAAPAANPNDPFAAPAPAEAPAPAPAAAPADGGDAKPTKPKYLLFRFLDFNVESTKIYRYRVKLVVANPNFKLDQAHLDNPKLAEGETRETPWSEPSAPVSVPVLERYFAGDNKSIGGDSEPEVNFAVKKWIPRVAADVYYEFKNKYRGAKLNENATVLHRVPGTNTSTEQALDLTTDVLLADFAWERTDLRLKGPGTGFDAKTVNKPSEVLVRTPRGELFIQTFLGDWPLRDEMKAVADAKSAAGGVAAPAPGAAQPPAGGDVRRVLQLQ